MKKNEIFEAKKNQKKMAVRAVGEITNSMVCMTRGCFICVALNNHVRFMLFYFSNSIVI
jgi:hypothetical protein